MTLTYPNPDVEEMVLDEVSHRDVSDPVPALSVLERAYIGDFSVAVKRRGEEIELHLWGDDGVCETAREVMRRCDYTRMERDGNVETWRLE